MPKERKAELSFLYGTRRLVLFYISALKIFWRVFDWKRGHKFYFKQNEGRYSKSKKTGKPELSFLYTTCHLVHFYQVSAKYSNGYSSNRADKKFYTDTHTYVNGIHPKNIMSQQALVGGNIILSQCINRKVFNQKA